MKKETEEQESKKRREGQKKEGKEGVRGRGEGKRSMLKI